MSDDTPDFRESQRRHGEKIRMERNIMDTYGVSRTQARNALKGIREFQLRVEEQRSRQVVVQEPPRFPQISSAELQAPPLSQAPKAATSRNAAGTQGSGTVLGPIVLTLSKNGIPTDYNINAEEVP